MKLQKAEPVKHYHGLVQVARCSLRPSADNDAYMALALNNAQGELSPLEIGLHALGSELNGSEYARQIGVPQGTMKDRICAARVAQEISRYPLNDFLDRWQSLSAIHAAPQWLWRPFGRRAR
jgi:hypothetical protein